MDEAGHYTVYCYSEWSEQSADACEALEALQGDVLGLFG